MKWFLIWAALMDCQPSLLAVNCGPRAVIEKLEMPSREACEGAAKLNPSKECWTKHSGLFPE